jgi:hypothetical protein
LRMAKACLRARARGAFMWHGCLGACTLELTYSTCLLLFQAGCGGGGREVLHTGCLLCLHIFSKPTCRAAPHCIVTFPRRLRLTRLFFGAMHRCSDGTACRYKAQRRKGASLRGHHSPTSHSSAGVRDARVASFVNCVQQVAHERAAYRSSSSPRGDGFERNTSAHFFCCSSRRLRQCGWFSSFSGR